MTSVFAKPQFLVAALVALVASFVLIKWMGHTIRSQLGPVGGKRTELSPLAHVDGASPALVKQAIERGLVTPAQLAAMTPVERQFLLASMKDKVGATSSGVTPRPKPGAGRR